MDETRAFLACIRRPACRTSLVPAGLVLAVLVGILPAFADTPESGTDPSVTLTVTPSDFLSDGQTVTVTGTGFPPNSAGTIRECGGTVAAPECDATISVPFVTTATGEIPPTNVTVKRTINTGTTTFNCGVQNCALVASAGGRTSQHHIRMAGAGTIPPTSVPPTSVPPTTRGTQPVCAILRALAPLPFFGGLITSLLTFFGCSATA